MGRKGGKGKTGPDSAQDAQALSPEDQAILDSVVEGLPHQKKAAAKGALKRMPDAERAALLYALTCGGAASDFRNIPGYLFNAMRALAPSALKASTSTPDHAVEAVSRGVRYDIDAICNCLGTLPENIGQNLVKLLLKPSSDPQAIVAAIRTGSLEESVRAALGTPREKVAIIAALNQVIDNPDGALRRVESARKEEEAKRKEEEAAAAQGQE